MSGIITLGPLESYLPDVPAAGSTGFLEPTTTEEVIQPQGNLFTRTLSGVGGFLAQAVSVAPSLANSLAILRGDEAIVRQDRKDWDMSGSTGGKERTQLVTRIDTVDKTERIVGQANGGGLSTTTMLAGVAIVGVVILAAVSRRR